MLRGAQQFLAVVLVTLLLGPSGWLAHLASWCPDTAARDVRTIVVRDPGELDRLAKQLKGSCYPFVLRFELLARSASRWTPERLAHSPEPWFITSGTPILALDLKLRSNASAAAVAAEMPLDAWHGLREPERARHYARANSRRFAGFGEDFRLLFGEPHELFDYVPRDSPPPK